MIALTVVMQMQSAQAQNCSEYQQAVELAVKLDAETQVEMKRIDAMPRKPRYDDRLCAAAMRVKEQWVLVRKLGDPKCVADPKLYIGLTETSGQIIDGMNKMIKDFCR